MKRSICFGLLAVALALMLSACTVTTTVTTTTVAVQSGGDRVWQEPAPLYWVTLEKAVSGGGYSVSVLGEGVVCGYTFDSDGVLTVVGSQMLVSPEGALGIPEMLSADTLMQGGYVPLTKDNYTDYVGTILVMRESSSVYSLRLEQHRVILLVETGGRLFADEVICDVDGVPTDVCIDGVWMEVEPRAGGTYYLLFEEPTSD